MNKFFTKIATAFVGMTMAIGVGVAVASSREAVPAKADSVTVTSEFSDKDWNVTTASDFGWTATKSGNSKETRGVQVLTSQSGVVVTADTSYDDITSVSIWLSKSNKGVGSVALKVGETTVKTQSSFNNTATEVKAPNLNSLSGVVSFTVTCTTNSIYVQKVSITYTESEPEVDDWELTTGSLSVTTQPTDKNYYTDDTDSNINKEGAVIKANYWSHDNHTITKQVDVTEEVEWSLDLANSKIDLLYTDEAEDTQTGSISITVNDTVRPKLATWDLSKASYNSASTTKVVWTSAHASMTWDKNTSSQNANAYLGGSNSTSRAYTNQIITIAASAGYGITKFVFTGESGYLGGVNGDWSGDDDDYTSTLSGTTLTVDLSGDISTSLSFTVTGTTRFTALSVYYTTYSAVAMDLTAENNKTILTSVGGTVQLTATAYADSEKTIPMSGIEFDFESAAASVATVSDDGLVTAVATGTSVITASYEELSATLTITVLYVTVDLVNDGSVLEKGDTGSFTFTWSSESLKPSSPTVVWSSSDNNAIVVEEDGSYLAGDDGASATITVTVTKDGYTYTASREFSVVSSIVAPTHISVTEKKDGVVSYVETNVSLHITVLGAGDAEATNQNVACTSSDSNILTVTDAGVITPKARGVAIVTVVDEGLLCEPVKIRVRVRNKVIGDAKIMGVLTAPNPATSTGNIVSYFETQNNYDAPSSATQTGGYDDKPGYFRIASSSSSGSISITYSDLKITKLVIVGKRWSANKADPTISGATADKAFTADDTTVTFTFTDATKTFTLTASNGDQFCCKSITVYGEKSDETSSANAQACYAFEEKYMHLDDYDTGLHEGVNGDNWCKDTDHNYYQKDDTKDGAKKGFNALSDKQKEMFMTNAAFADAWKRLQNWATANGDVLNGDNELAQATRYIPSSIISGENAGLAGLITIISVITGLSICGYFLLRRRKENN